MCRGGRGVSQVCCLAHNPRVCLTVHDSTPLATKCTQSGPCGCCLSRVHSKICVQVCLCALCFSCLSRRDVFFSIGVCSCGSAVCRWQAWVVGCPAPKTSILPLRQYFRLFRLGVRGSKATAPCPYSLTVHQARVNGVSLETHIDMMSTLDAERKCARCV